MHAIQSWIESVNDRSDLLKKWKERPIVLFFHGEQETVPLTISTQNVRIDYDYEFHCPVHVHAPSQIIEKMLEGEVQLSKLPADLGKIEGKLRDILYVESLMLLAR
ncbi:hypothetical protein [Halobacillus sp. Marseille-Q1614]|uniref:hypothetical protein n=1 Tax=Halobacillus sp. Marseille-Q1614 TaxID=2709134 RepID=UPI00156FE3C5|nr:hypothetical protein [Halobacillus sp. Marseille-Q1614]